ncbi:MAG: rhodanese-like domain-containing protein [Campylobacterota bacterium]|nr:rhodanese-like domain-containing protein [Campylobacterota bacterium]
MSLNIYPTKEMLDSSDMIIVDIRTSPEWKRSGVVEGSKCITFFEANGSFDYDGFLKKIDELGGKSVEIGLICRTGARTSQVASMMAKDGYNVKNLAGGVMKLAREGYDLAPYK